MKKILTIFLVGFYLAFNAGLIVNLHFCDTILNHLAVLVEPEECCEDGCSCCDNVAYQFSIDDSYDNNIRFLVNATPSVDIAPVSAGTDILKGLDNSSDFSVVDKLRVDPPKVPAYLTNRVFRI